MHTFAYISITTVSVSDLGLAAVSNDTSQLTELINSCDINYNKAAINMNLIQISNIPVLSLVGNRQTVTEKAGI